VGTLGTALGFVVLAAGLVISLQQSFQPNQAITWVAIVPWFTLGVGILALNVGKYYAMRYSTRPRVDQALASSLKSLDNKNHLYNFVPGFPVEHVLATPSGVILLDVEPFTGEVINEGRKWTRPVNASGILQRFTDGGIGNPTEEADRNQRAMRELLGERLGADLADQIPVASIIVFTNPRVKLQVTDPAVPVVLLGDLRGALKRALGTPKLTPDLQRRLVRALQWEPQTTSTAAVTNSRSSTWQRTQK
jgi:hypothetical protein